MSGKGRFRYELEPLRLTREWDLMNLRIELVEQNAQLMRQQQELADLHQQHRDASADWASRQLVTVDHFAMRSRYCEALNLKIELTQQTLEQLNGARDALIERVTVAQRGLDAVEEHRDDMHDKFVQQRQSDDFKIADDQWNTLQAGAVKHDR